MDVCDFNYTHINNLNISEKNFINVEPRTNWKKIGEVHSNTQSQCLIVCTVCNRYGEQFDHAYTTNDASAFWNHIQTQHKDCPLFNDESCPQVENNTQELHSESCDETNKIVVSAESANISCIENTKGTLLPDNRRLDSNKYQAQGQLLEANGHKHEHELQIDDVPLSDINSTNSNSCDNQIVDISDDEGASSPSFVQNDQINGETDNAIELSDDEEDDSRFNFRSSEQYKCELCSELFMDQNNLNEHKKTHEIHDDVLGNGKVPQIGLQPSSKDSDNDLQHNRCKFCRKQFFTILQLTEHETVHIAEMVGHEQNNFLLPHCNKCGEYFSSVDILRNHEQTEHNYGTEMELLKCFHCQKIVSKSNLELHISTEHKEIYSRNILLYNTFTQSLMCAPTRPFKCSLCGRRTTTEATMITHHKRFHSTTLDPSTAKCEVCNKLVLVRNLNLHMTSKHGHRSRIKCPHCSRFYFSRSNFLIHMKQSHSTSALPPHQIVEDSLSSSSATTLSEFTSEEMSEYSNGEYPMNIEAFSDSLNDEEEFISYGEVIPININNGTHA